LKNGKRGSNGQPGEMACVQHWCAPNTRAPELLVKRAPAHAGRLRPWERTVFALIFALMAGFVVLITMSAARSHGHETGRPSAASSAAIGAGPAGQRAGRRGSGGDDQPAGQGGAGTDVAGSAQQSAELDARLAGAVQRATRGDAGQIAVGVIDTSTGATAVYHPARHFHTASIVKVDILAALLLQHQRARTQLSNRQADLAVAMIEDSSDTAANQLWTAIGGAAGLQAADGALRLSHTVASAYWGLTSTTVIDQLQLLRDLTSASAIDSAGRDYVLGLMAGVQAGQQWGVPAAATPGTGFAVKDGWLADPQLWAINSIGVIDHRGHELLVVVLSKDNPTEAGGIAMAQAAAVAAADVVAGS
jgi:Beta-lactamase enzyme family